GVSVSSRPFGSHWTPVSEPFLSIADAENVDVLWLTTVYINGLVQEFNCRHRDVTFDGADSGRVMECPERTLVGLASRCPRANDARDEGRVRPYGAAAEHSLAMEDDKYAG